MISHDIILKIQDLPILEVCSKLGIDLKKAGVNYNACCPIHKEKTPSFVVSPAKNIFHCFGCGVGGNVVRLVMENEKKDWIEAVKFLAKLYHIDIPKDHFNQEEQQNYKVRESLLATNNNVQKFFLSNLKDGPLEYAKTRWDEKTIDQWGIGFAGSEWQGLVNYAKKNAINTDALNELGLIKAGEKGYYDFFKDRITIPVHNQYGRIIGYTARIIVNDDLKGKYLNNKESIVFVKNQVLFGIFYAYKAIRTQGFAYLVEGAPDVIKMHFCNAENTVAPLGTSLTENHLQELSRHCKNLTFVIETDEAGIKAVIRNAKMAVKHGFSVSVLALPEDFKDDIRVKHDPDSFFKNSKHFKNYASDNTHDFIVWYSNRMLSAVDASKRDDVINDICELVAYVSDKGKIEYYLHTLQILIKPKKMWAEKIAKIQKESQQKEEDKKKPKNLDQDHIEKYGFFEEHSSVFFMTKNGIQRGANFALQPLFHVASVTNSKRLYLIKNEHNFEQIIELKQDEMINLSKFKVRVESLGNFLWYLGESELNKYKSWLYEKTETCYEITQMGWQKDGFWAWGNGIFSEKFIATDSNGIVNLNGRNYYLPAVSSVWEKEQSLFQFERKFIHLDKSTISLHDYAIQLIKVFGDNAIIGLCFIFATLYRDIVFRTTKFFPILNLFGPKGAGKSALGHSLTTFFIVNNIPPNLNNATIPALADVVSQSANAVVHIDEYKNSVEFEKIEFLKGLWDGAGRTRMNMDRDKKRETTTVDCGVALSGQEMPTVDIALFSRLIFITFHKTEYTDKEKSDFNKLREIEKKGLTHLTNQLVNLRKYVESDFIQNYNSCTNDIQTSLKGEVIEDRLFRNWLVPLSIFKTIESYIQVPFKYKQLLEITIEGIKKQNGETKRNNELSNFWNIFEYLVKDGLLEHRIDFYIKHVTTLKTDKINRSFEETKKIIIINHTKAFQLYRKHGKVASDKILPISTLQYYLQNSKEYLGVKKSVAFLNRDAVTKQIMENFDKNGVSLGKKYQVTNAYVFDYELLGISVDYITSENYDADGNEIEDGKISKVVDLEKEPVENDIPF